MKKLDVELYGHPLTVYYEYTPYYRGDYEGGLQISPSEPPQVEIFEVWFEGTDVTWLINTHNECTIEDDIIRYHNAD